MNGRYLYKCPGCQELVSTLDVDRYEAAALCPACAAGVVERRAATANRRGWSQWYEKGRDRHER